MRVLIAGDFCQKNRVSNLVANKRYDTLFNEIRSSVKSVDYSIVNFEFPIVKYETSAKPIRKCGPNLRGTIEAIDAVKYAGFKCCTLANNHILDQGEHCCLDTKIELEKAGVDTVGVGYNLSEAGAILYRVINGETIAIINCCEHEYSIATQNSAGANPLNPIEQYYAIQEAKRNSTYILVIIHGGHEYYQLPSPRMQETYRFFIDAGADAVVNHHQHCFSGYEIYKGKPIVYGLGNLCFDNYRQNDIWNEGYMVVLSFEKHNISIDKLVPYVQCNGDIGVHLLLDSMEFYQKIIELNNIISNPVSLSENISRYYHTTAYSVLSHFQPYNSKIANRLYKLHILPSFISKKKWLKLINNIECESHRDKLIYAFNEFFKNNEFTEKNKKE